MFESYPLRPPSKTTDQDVVIEIPSWTFVKRGANGRVDFISPLPCPFNYGAYPAYLGLDDDYLDAVVLGPRRARGSRVRAPARGAIGFLDRGIYEHKLILSDTEPGPRTIAAVVAFFRLYALFKRLLNCWRGYHGATRCLGWQPAASAWQHARRLPLVQHSRSSR